MLCLAYPREIKHTVIALYIDTKGDRKHSLKTIASLNCQNYQTTAAMNELIFIVEEASERGFIARAFGESIFTEANNLANLHSNIRDAVRCHFDQGNAPKLIRLHFVREEVIKLPGKE